MTINKKTNLSFHLLVLIPLLANAGCRTAGAAPRVCAGPVEVRTEADVAAIAGCDAIDGDLLITGSLSELHLESLRSVRYLVVAGTALQDLTGLSGLQSASGMTIAGNQRLTSLRGLEGVERLEGIFIVANESLVGLDGLEGLEHADEVVLEANPRLATLAGLRGLSEAHFEVSLETHPALSREDAAAVERRLVIAALVP